MPCVGLIDGQTVVPLASGVRGLSTVLHADLVEKTIDDLLARAGPPHDLATIQIEPPLDAQEVWGAGVTYERSKIARQEESEQGGSFYDKVYRSPARALLQGHCATGWPGPINPSGSAATAAGRSPNRSWPS